MYQPRNHTIAPLIGRILLSLIFILSGLMKLFNFDQTSGYMGMMGLPSPDLLLLATIGLEVIGGLMILLGWHAHLASIAIFLWLLPTTFIFHAFWAAPAEQVQAEMNNFLKNIAIMGGMLYIWAFGTGALSLDGRRHRRDAIQRQL